ncbi:MAG: SRPBCC domain-containing protein [Gemmatimonadales bacterium]
MADSNAPLPPVRRSVWIRRDPEAAFRRFTEEIGTWWPHRSHSVGGDRVVRVVFESGVGGRIFEEHDDGRRFQWGTVLGWDPPDSVVFSWHPSRSPDTAQRVTVRFAAEAGGTRLSLEHTGWEALGDLARTAQRGYGLGWRGVLDVYAGRLSAVVGLTGLISAVQRVVTRFRPGDGRDRAGGEIQPTA